MAAARGGRASDNRADASEIDETPVSAEEAAFLALEATMLDMNGTTVEFVAESTTRSVTKSVTTIFLKRSSLNQISARLLHMLAVDTVHRIDLAQPRRVV